MAGWPTDLDPHVTPELARSALLVIDTQVDFLDGGASPIPGTSEVLVTIAELLAVYRAAGLLIVHVVRLYDGQDVDLPRRSLIQAGAPLVRPGSPGSQIAPLLRPDGAPDLDPDLLLTGRLQQFASAEWAMWKPRWGAFHRTRLDQHLQSLRVSTVVLTGCNYPNCPRAAVYGASEHDYRVLIVSDAISGVQAFHLGESGRLGAVHAPTAAVVEAVQRLHRVTAAAAT